MCDKIKQNKYYQKMRQFFQTIFQKGKSAIEQVQKTKYALPVFWGIVVLIGFGLLTFLNGSHRHAVIGVLDIDRLRAEAAPYQEIEREKAKYMELWKVKFQAEQEVLDAEDKRLAEVQQKKSMKKAAFKKAVDELQKKALELQKKYQKEATKIMMATNSATEQIDNLALEQMQAVAKKQGYDVVLAIPVTLYVSETVDMTDAVIQALNKKAVKINYPDPDTLTPPAE